MTPCGARLAAREACTLTFKARHTESETGLMHPSEAEDSVREVDNPDAEGVDVPADEELSSRKRTRAERALLLTRLAEY